MAAVLLLLLAASNSLASVSAEAGGILQQVEGPNPAYGITLDTLAGTSSPDGLASSTWMKTSVSADKPTTLKGQAGTAQECRILSGLHARSCLGILGTWPAQQSSAIADAA